MRISRSTARTASITRSTTRTNGWHASATPASAITRRSCSSGDCWRCGSRTPTRFRSTTPRTPIASCRLHRRGRAARGLRPLAGDLEEFADLRGRGRELKAAAPAFNRQREARARTAMRRSSSAAERRQCSWLERALIDPAGIPGRPWYRHLIYAPKYTYAPEVLPGVAEAVDARQRSRRARRPAGVCSAAPGRSGAPGGPRQKLTFNRGPRIRSNPADTRNWPLEHWQRIIVRFATCRNRRRHRPAPADRPFAAPWRRRFRLIRPTRRSFMC